MKLIRKKQSIFRSILAFLLITGLLLSSKSVSLAENYIPPSGAIKISLADGWQVPEPELLDDLNNLTKKKKSGNRFFLINRETSSPLLLSGFFDEDFNVWEDFSYFSDEQIQAFLQAELDSFDKINVLQSRALLINERIFLTITYTSETKDSFYFRASTATKGRYHVFKFAAPSKYTQSQLENTSSRFLQTVTFLK